MRTTYRAFVTAVILPLRGSDDDCTYKQMRTIVLARVGFISKSRTHEGVWGSNSKSRLFLRPDVELFAHADSENLKVILMTSGCDSDI
jgi:hypothetical protein